MYNFSRALRTFSVVVALLFATSASAVTYFNSNDSSIHTFGAPDTTSYGQVFNINAGGGILADWTFWANSGNAGNLNLVVASWDGTKAVGPALYSSSLFAYAGGASALAFTGINAALEAGSYISYITVAGIAEPATGMWMGGSNSDGGLGGGFRFLNSQGVDPLALNSNWSSWYIPNMAFSANILSPVAPVPEPETYAMLLVGLGLFGFMARRREHFNV
jgi:hypothetical protein